MDARPLDLVFFRGSDILSGTIVMMEKMMSKDVRPFSHVGIIVNKDVLPIEELEDGILYVLESTVEIHHTPGTSIPKDIRGKRRTGVQIRVLMDVIHAYHGAAAIGRLKAKIEDPKPILLSFWKEYKDGGYDGDIISLLSTVFPCLRPISKTSYHLYTEVGKVIHIGDIPSSYLICSELVGIIYQRLGIIPKNIDPSTITPMDFLGGRDLPIVVEDPTYIL